MGLIATNDSLAAVVRNALLVLYSGVGHISQVPLDLATVVSQTGHGLANLDIPTDNIQAAVKKAFIFDVNNKESSASSGVIGQMANKLGAGIENGIRQHIQMGNNSHADTHARAANSTGAGTIIASTILPLAAGLLTDTIGHGFREGSAVGHFSADESASNADEKNVYHASKQVAKATQDSDSHASQERLRQLNVALAEINPVDQLMSNQTITTPLATVVLRLVVLALFVDSSRGLSKAAIVTAEGQIQKALADATAQGPSAGVDRINSLHSNLSSLSNIMRLCAENLGGAGAGASAIKTVAQSGEVISSRAMSVLLSHVSELAEALRQLVSPREGENSLSMASRSIEEMAKPQVLGQSEAIIKAVLDRIEQQNQQHVIPDLNKDMAAQLNNSVYTGIVSLLATHSIFTNPVMLGIKGSTQAAKINDDQMNEALMATLPGMTQVLNVIQASTRNFMAAMEQKMASNASQNEDCFFFTHETVAGSTAAVYWSISAIALLCDEMLSIARSLTLLDQNRLQALSQKASEVNSKDESAQSAEQIAWDSHSEENNNATHAITALRLTLSHTGIALMRIALELHNALKDNMDVVQQNLAMHTLQKNLLTCSAYAARYLAEGLMFSTGSVFAFPVSLNGSANWSHKKVHSTHAQLHPVQTHSSEHFSQNNPFQFIGFGTDIVAGTVSNVLKVLAQGSLIGLDTTLKLIKVLEIISLHRDSHIALQLETNASSQPNGLLQNTVIEPSVGSFAGTGAVLMNLLEAVQNIDHSSGTQSTLNAQDGLKDVIDQQIEGLAILKDDEEDRDNKIGLKGFYKIIIRLLSPEGASHYDSLIKRLDFGGISLSSYHSIFGAYSVQPATDLNFIREFSNDDDAQGVLRKFIDKAKQQLPLLKSLHDALPDDQRSKKVQSLYEHIFDELFQHYKQIKMSDIAQCSSSRRRIPTRATFISDLGLDSIELVVEGDDHSGRPGFSAIPN